MDRLDGTTGDTTERKPTFLDGGASKSSHLNEQPDVDPLRREKFHEITTGSVGSHRHSNESRVEVCLQTKEPASGSTTSSSGKWFEWVHVSPFDNNKPLFEQPSPSNKDVTRDDCNQSHPIESPFKMIKNHYIITIVCLSLVIIACLLASVVISRSIGESDLDAATSKDEGSRQMKQLLVDPLELRTIELVDLMECGKTFAYARWRVKVLVPKSSAIYKQHLAVASSSNQFSLLAENKVAVNKILEVNNNNSKPDKMNSKVPNLSSPTRIGAIDLNLVVDPLELAANEMSVKLNEMNNTLVDCFLVDTEKRLEQKQSIEQRHIKEAVTRRVDFKSMLTIIQACRSLTLASLNSTINNQGLVKMTTTPDVDGAQLVDEHQMKALNQMIVPVEGRSPGVLSRPLTRRNAEQTPPPLATRTNDNNAFGSLVDALVATLSSAGNSAETPNARRGIVEPPASIANNPRNAATTTQTELATTGSRPLDDEAQRASYINMGMSMMSGIVPNTLWCGLGDRASNYSELGSEFQVDACCRAHDHCPIRLKPFSADYQLINWSMSTRSHCDCDIDFNDCLTALNSTLSNVIKALYFRFVGLQCIDLDGRQNSIAPVE